MKIRMILNSICGITDNVVVSDFNTLQNYMDDLDAEIAYLEEFKNELNKVDIQLNTKRFSKKNNVA